MQALVVIGIIVALIGFYYWLVLVWLDRKWWKGK